MINIENLKLDFPRRLDFFIDRLSIKKGRIFTVIGPNGAGKSTFLNILGLFQKPDSGKVEIRGRDILKLKDKLAFRRSFSFIFSQPFLFNDSVHNNIALPLRLRGINNTNAVDEMLGLFQIGHLKGVNARTLSQGEMHRVALARALVSRPQLLLLDEPFLSLDPHYKEGLMSQLRRIIHTRGITAILVTQDQNEALSLADVLAVMKQGRLLQAGRPEEIFTKPESKEVADFVGVETILEGVIAKKEAGLCFIKVADSILEAVSEYEIGDSVFVCIRPEDVVISMRADENSARNHFKTKIINIQQWGLEHKLNLDCGFNLIASLTKQSVEGMNLQIGQIGFASFKATAVHLIRRDYKDA